MLNAFNQTGRLVNLATATLEEISNLKKSELFYCPECGDKVVVKAGSKVTAHFAHLPSSNCQIHKGGEGEYHERGKKQLYLWLARQGVKVELEKYFSSIKQRPDLYFMLGKHKIAIEFQCATISHAELLNRNKGYYSQNIQPIWILGGNRLKRSDSNSVLLGTFERFFLHQFSPDFPLTLYFFCPNSRLFFIFQHIQTTGKKKSYGSCLFRKLDKLSFKFLFQRQHLSFIALLQFWQKQMYAFRTLPPFHIGSTLENQWRQSLYRKGIHPSLLPSIANLPVAGQYQMKSPPWVWQSQICLNIINQCSKEQKVYPASCIALLRRHFLKKNTYPLICSPVDPIDEYLSFLTALGYLDIHEKTSYIVNRQVKVYQNVEKAIEGDELLISQLSRNPSFLSNYSNH